MEILLLMAAIIITVLRGCGVSRELSAGCKAYRLKKEGSGIDVVMTKEAYYYFSCVHVTALFSP